MNQLFLTALLGVLLCCARAPLGATDRVYGQTEGILQEALDSKNPNTRKHAVAALSLAASRPTYTAKLVHMLDDKDAEVRVAAVSSLSEVRSSQVITALRRTLDDSVPEVAFSAARTLWMLNDPEGKRALLAVMEGETKASSSFLSRQKREALRMMHTPRTALLFAIKEGAGFAPIPGLGTGVSSMQAILTDPEVSGRAAAALLLAQRRDPVVLKAMQEALREKDTSLRAAAVHCLALTNNPGFRKDIQPLLEDDKEAVRLRAAAAYIRLSSFGARRTRGASRPSQRPIQLMEPAGPKF